MLKNVKKGFGLMAGMMLGYATISTIADSILRCVAKDEQFLERQKDRNPDLYEKLKKYQPKKEESVEEEES